MARVSLNDLIGAGLLKPGDQLSCEPRKGELYKAKVEVGGEISYYGKLYDSPTQWAKEVARNSRNGWTDVHFNGRPLSELRAKLLGGPPDDIRGSSGPQDNGGDGDSVIEPPPEPPIHQHLLTRLRSLPAADFEKLVGKVLEALGLSRVTVTGRVADGGIDGEATIPVFNVTVAFQAKRYAQDNNVGIDPVQRLRGTVRDRYDRGVLITTSSFTPGAKEEAARPDSRIVLIDGQSLVSLMVERNIGVRKVPVVTQEVDIAFFDGLTMAGP